MDTIQKAVLAISRPPASAEELELRMPDPQADIFFALRADRQTATQTRRGQGCRKMRVKALAALGGKCAKCGCTDARALQIDHINGGGSQEAKRIGSYGIYRRALTVEGRKDYQVLCANCNWIKREVQREAFRK